MNVGLGGRIALVTGAGGGIGAAIAAKLVDEGCVVYLADISESAARAASDRLGERAHALTLDVTEPGEIRSAVDRIVARESRIDILVNNAGILKAGSVIESSIDDWDEVCSANLSSVYYCSKAVLPAMLERCYGKIVNIASISAVKGGGVFGNVLYGTTKAGVVAFTKGFARELAPHGINVNAVAPGVVETAMTRGKLAERGRNEVVATMPMGRFASVDDVANAVAFLASDAAAYITGHTLVVDGGYLTR